MLTSTGAIRLNRLRHEMVIQAFGFFPFLLAVWIEQHQHMEITIADVAYDGARKARFLEQPSRFVDALRKPRNRHTYIGRACTAAWPQLQASKIGVMPRGPEAVAIFWAFCPFKIHPTAVFRELLHRLCLLFHAGFGAVEFK